LTPRKEPLIHPFTFFLVADIQRAYDNAQLDISNSLKNLLYLALSLDEKGQTALQKEIRMMAEVEDGTLRIKDKQKFRDIYSLVLRELHKEGYFEAAKLASPRVAERGKLGKDENDKGT
jgi:hypothetical protein